MNVLHYVQIAGFFLWILFFFKEDPIEAKLKKVFDLKIHHLHLDLWVTLFHALLQCSVYLFADGVDYYSASHGGMDFGITFLSISLIIGLVVYGKRLDFNDVFAKFAAGAKTPKGEYDRLSLGSFILSGIQDNTAQEDVHLSSVDLTKKDPRIDISISAANAGGAGVCNGDATTIYLTLIKAKVGVLAIMWVIIPAAIGHLITHLMMRGQVSDDSGSIVNKKDIESKIVWFDVIYVLLALVSIPVTKSFVFNEIAWMEKLHVSSVFAILTAFFLVYSLHTIKKGFVKLTQHEWIEIVKPSLLLGLMVLQVFPLGYSGLLGLIAEQVVDAPFLVIILSAFFLSWIIDNMAVVALFVLIFESIFPTGHAFWSILAVSAGMAGSSHLPASAAGLVYKTMYALANVGDYLRNAGLKSTVGGLVAVFIAYGMYLLGIIGI